MSGTTDGSWGDDEDDDVICNSLRDASRTGMAPDGHDDQSLAMMFTVTNPPATVSVTASADGRPIHVLLATQLNGMTERELGEEIVVIARLAGQNARAGQHLIATTMLQDLGHDRTSARTYVEHELGLPSPQTALADKVHVFATRYADDG